MAKIAEFFNEWRLKRFFLIPWLLRRRIRNLNDLKRFPGFGSAKLVSFDVFDTALLRSVARPADTLALSAWRGEQRLACGIEMRTLLEARTEAEIQARRWARAEGREEVTLDEIYAASDYISLHTNLTQETRDMISAKSFAKMKQGVLILNCARGEVVNTNDMVAALKSGQVGGYGTDVLDQEPPAADHPLLSLPNVVCTPHVASRTYESVVRQATCSVKNWLTFSQSVPLVCDSRWWIM